MWQIEDWKHLSFPVAELPEDQAGTDEIKEEQEVDDDQDQD